MNSSILFHEAGIEFILLIIILLSYYSKSIPEKYMSICLLGTYILSKSALTLGHAFYHERLEKVSS